MNVPREFQRPIQIAYPEGNANILEQWLMNKIDHPDYLPINWCGYFVNHDYGNNKRAMEHLNRYLKTLDTSKHYFSVTQYDLGIIADISHLNIKVFGSGGGRIDFPIPLICHPHGAKHYIGRNIFASFIGSMTHPIRNEIMKYKGRDGWYISDARHSTPEFCDVMARSIFSIVPRGFGLSSFRICEALEQGSIPIYVSDEWIIPGNVDFNTYGVLVHSSEINELDAILANVSEDQIRSKQEAGREIYKRIYSFEGCRQLILDNL